MNLNQVRHHRRAYLLLTLTALCWGANAVFGRMAVGEISPMALVSLRWGGVLLLLVLFARESVRRDWRVLRTRLGFVFILGSLGFTAFNALFYVAAHTTSAVNIGIIQGSIPVFALLGVFVAYGQRFSVLQAIGVTITLFGVLIVATAGQLADLADVVINRGDILMVVACSLYAGYAVALQRRPPVASLSLFTVLAASAFISSLPLMAIEAGLGGLLWPSPKGWLIVAFIALFPSFIAQLFFMHGVQLIGPGRAAVFVNLVPVFAALLAVIFLHEAFQPHHAAALALVLGGIGLSERNHGTVKA